MYLNAKDLHPAEHRAYLADKHPGSYTTPIDIFKWRGPKPSDYTGSAGLLRLFPSLKKDA